MFDKTRYFIGILLINIALVGCGSDEKTTTTSPAASTAVTWADAKTIISAKCGGSACHASGAPYLNFVDSESSVKTNAASLAVRIRATGSTKMPPASSSDLTSGEKSQLLAYLDAQ